MLNDLPIELLKSFLTYDEFSGDLIWRHRERSHFPNDQAYNAWNARFPEKKVGAVSNGYVIFSIFKRLYKAHRVAWAIYHGEWPDRHLDHIDGNRSNNRISNLRVVSRTENNMNMARKSTNTSGQTGVSRTKSGMRWRARIQANGKAKTIGSFATKEQAIAARKLAEVYYGFHDNHGREEGFGK